MNEGQIEDAIEASNNKVSSLIQLCNELGQKDLNMGRYEEAIDFFDQVIEKDENNLTAWEGKGIAFNYLQRYKEASKSFENAINSFHNLIEQRKEVSTHMESSKTFFDKESIKNLFVNLWYQKGLSLLNWEKYEEAIDCFNKAIEIDKDFVDAWHNKGVSLGNLKKYDDALQSFEKVIEKYPNDVDALRNYGFVLSKLNRYDEAINILNKATKIKSHFAYAWNTKGYVYLDQGEKYYDEAIKCFQKAVDTDPNFSHAWYNKGYALIHKEKYKEALDCINNAINIDPRNALAWNYKGYAHLGLKRYDDAMRDFDKAIEMDPKCNVEAWNYKGISILCSQQKNDEAIDCFDKAIEIDEKNKHAWNNKGYALNSLQRYKEAIDCFDKAIEIDKDFADAWHNKGVSLGNSGNDEESYNYRQAIECFEKAIENLGNGRDILENLRNGRKINLDIDHDLAGVLHDLADISRKEGFAYGRIGEHDKAKDCFTIAVLIYEHIRPFDKDMDIDVAYTLNSKGYYFITNSLEKYHKEAIECFEKAIKVRPNFAYPYYNKGFVLSKLEKYDQAIEYLDKAIKVDPDLAYAWNNKGYALNSLGKYDEALKCFDNAINIFNRNMKNGDDPNYSNLAYAWNNKGYALNSLQRYKEAIECFDNSLGKYEDIKKHRKRISREIKVDPDLAYAWNNKGYALNSLGKYDEALKCFDNAVTIYEEIKKHDGNADIKKAAEDITYLRKGQSEYMLDDYVSALADFRKINEDNSKVIGDKHNNVGLCYYRQHKFQQAEQEYIKATESSSKSTIANAYYNLAILYNSRGRPDKAMRMCEDCLKSDPNFSKAREALYKLKSSPHQSLEWYSWWFSHVKGKKALGVLLISSILAPLLIVSLAAYHVYFVMHDLGKLTSFVEHNLNVLVTAVITMMGLSIAVLLLPSLTKIKVGSIVELETVPTIYTTSNSIELEAFSATPSLISVSMPEEIPLQHFRMPLQILRMPNKFPLKSVYMPFQRHDHRER